MRALSTGADLLLPAGQSLHALVLARFHHAVHLMLDDGRLMTLLRGDAPHGMRVINVAHVDWVAIHPWLDAGQRALLDAAQLSHARFVLRRSARVWQAPDLNVLMRDVPDMSEAGGARGQAIRTCRAWLRQRQGVMEAGMSAPAWRLWRAALLAFGGVLDAMQAHADGEARIDAAVAGALGLGPGLTPSADDMIAGLLIGLRAARVTDPCVAQLAVSVRRHWHATSTASRDMLEQAMRGWTTSCMADVCTAVAHGAAVPGLAHALAKQAAIGQCSGVDTLIGFCAGLDAGSTCQAGAVPLGAGAAARRKAPNERMPS